jgi:uncharacterized membrane protein
MTRLYTLAMAELLNLSMRWLHLSSMATLVGGLLYARLAALPAAGTMDAGLEGRLGEREAALYRPWLLAAMTGLVFSGLYNVVSTPGHTQRYHVLLGIKLLLVAHVFATALVASRPGNTRRARLMGGAALSGLLIVLISAYLRRIF